MALGDGCWAPGIHWDAENAAAFTGPRAGTYPYSAGADVCKLPVANNLGVDPLTGIVWSRPPDYQIDMSKSWSGGDGVPLPANFLIDTLWYNFDLSSHGIAVGAPWPKIPWTGPATVCAPRAWAAGGNAALTATFLVGTGESVILTGRMAPTTQPTTSAQAAPVRAAFYNPFPASATPTVAKDSSGNGRNGTVTSPAWTDFPSSGSTGNIPGSLDTDLGAYVIGAAGLPTAAGSSFTLSAWLYASSGSPFQAVLSAPMASSGATATIYTDGTHLSWQVNNSLGSSGGTAGTMAGGLYNHVVIIVQPGSVNAYVNGVSVGPTVIGSPLALTGALWAGRMITPPGPSPFFGRLSNVTAYGRALSGAEALALYNTPLSPPATPLVWWKLNDGYFPRTVTLQAYGLASGGDGAQETPANFSPVFQCYSDKVSASAPLFGNSVNLLSYVLEYAGMAVSNA